MNLGWISKTAGMPEAEESGTILHEFGHAIGLMHEHQSPARGGTLTLKENGTSYQEMEFRWLANLAAKPSISTTRGRKDGMTLS